MFRSNRSGLHELYVKAADGAGKHTPLIDRKGAKYPTDWTPDGRAIVYHMDQPATGSDIWLISADGSHSTPLVQTMFDEMQGQISPDGRWLAYTSMETGQMEVYVGGLTKSAARWQVSAGGGVDPRWRGYGRELFYVSADSSLTSVAFEAGKPAAPRRLFEIKTSPTGRPYLSNYDVTTGGQRFLVKVPVHDVASEPIHVVSNWRKTGFRLQ
jgi:Tol biopolymer transport system component